MASITNMSDVFKYMANNFGAFNGWQNANVSRQQTINTTDTAPADVSETNSSANVNSNANKNKNVAAAAGKSDSAVVSSAAQSASALNSQMQSTGSQNAAIFRSALTSLVSNFSANSASGALGSFLGFGAAMAETGNLKTYTDMSLMVTGLSKLAPASSAMTSKFINQAQASLQSFGAETAGSFINSAQKVMSFGAAEGANKGSQVSALNNLNKLWETASNLKGFSVEQKSGMLADIAANVESKGSLSELNDYLKQQLEAMDESAEEETLTEEKPGVSSGAIFNNLIADVYSNSAFVNTAPVEGFQSALSTAALKSGANTADILKNISAYKNNMNLSTASNLLNTGV